MYVVRPVHQPEEQDVDSGKGTEGLRRAVLLDADQPLEGDVDLGEVCAAAF